MNSCILQKISKDDFQLLLTSLEDVFYKSTSTYLKDEIINIVKEYICAFEELSEGEKKSKNVPIYPIFSLNLNSSSFKINPPSFSIKVIHSSNN